jgi:hypothetical protein
MRAVRFVAVAVLTIDVMCRAGHAAALQSFDRLFQGDDPTEGFSFTLPYDASTPTLLRFDGFAENLVLDETGVRFLLRWAPSGTDGGGEMVFPGEPQFGGVRLPGTDPLSGTTRVPLHFGTAIHYAPGGVLFVVEGLGPTDSFRFVGDLTLQPVPEPATWALLILGVIAVIVERRLAACRAGRESVLWCGLSVSGPSGGR